MGVTFTNVDHMTHVRSTQHWVITRHLYQRSCDVTQGWSAHSCACVAGAGICCCQLQCTPAGRDPAQSSRGSKWLDRMTRKQQTMCKSSHQFCFTISPSFRPRQHCSAVGLNFCICWPERLTPCTAKLATLCPQPAQTFRMQMIKVQFPGYASKEMCS